MLIPDHETEVDFLNCEAISQTVVEILKDNRSRPLTIGIHGDWGAGKSSILKMIECNLANDKKVACLWFNGWTFEGFDDAKTVLIESTISELCRQRSTAGKVKEMGARLLKRVNWLKVVKRGSGVAINVLTGLPSPDQIETVVSSLNAMAKDVTNLDPKDIQEKLKGATDFLKSANDGDNIPDAIHAFREEFSALLEEAQIDQLVVLIDDLDRCLPKTAIETLEAIRLFLFVPKTAFIIGADEAMIEYAVRQHFPDLPVASGPLSYTRNYLEKLVQIPFRIPALGAQETRSYVTLLLVQSLIGEDHDGFKALLRKAKEGLMKPWLGSGLSQADVQAVDADRREELDSAFVLAQQIGPMLTDGTKGNPRQVKRFLNALLIRQVIAKARGFGDLINQAVLAKLMLAERFQPDFYEHIAMQTMISNDGKVAEIAAMESAETSVKAEEKKKDDTKEKSKKSEESQQTDISKWLERDWLKRWLKIAPAIATEDLRPYVFVARDKRLLAGASESCGLDTLIIKLCGSQLALRAVEPEVKTLSDEDAGIVFAALRERVLSVGNFSNSPAGINGLSIVSKHHPRLQGELVSLLGSLDPSGLGLWVLKGWNESITESTARDRLQAIMQGWVNQDDNQMLKRAAPTALSSLQNGSD